MKKITFGLLTLFLCFVVSCRKKDLPLPAAPPVNETPTSGALKIKIENVVGDKVFEMAGLASYQLPNGDAFTVSTYNYYLSNFVFTDTEGKQFIEPESYHLIVANKPESLSFEISNIPSGKYRSVAFLIGVDSLHNVSGAQKGDLSPEHGMLWSWSTGYIMAKMEGKLFPSGKMLSYHIAGFKGVYNTIQNVKLDFPENAVVTKTGTPEVTFQSDLATWFKEPNFPGFTALPVISIEGEQAMKVAQNYRTMLRITQVNNP